MGKRTQSTTQMPHENRIEDLAPEPSDAEVVVAGKNVAKFKVSSELSAIVTK